MGTKKTTKPPPKTFKPKAAEEVDEPQDRVRDVKIKLPIAPVDPISHVGRHIDVQLNHDQARALHAVRAALLERHTRLANGRYIWSPADALRWVLEQVAEQARQAG